MATFNVQLNSRPRTDGRHLIMIRVTAGRKHKYYSIQKYIRRQDFNQQAKYGVWIRTSHPDHKLLNEIIRVRLREMENLDSDNFLIVPNRAINSVPQSETNKKLSFSEFTKKEIDRHKAKGQFRIAVKKTYLINKMAEAAG